MDHKPEHKTKRKYREENLCELGLGKLFLSPNDKRTIYTRKKKIDKFDSSELRTSTVQKMLLREKEQQTGRKYLQITYMIKNASPDKIKNPGNLMIHLKNLILQMGKLCSSLICKN